MRIDCIEEAAFSVDEASVDEEAMVDSNLPVRSEQLVLVPMALLVFAPSEFQLVEVPPFVDPVLAGPPNL